jgi:ankyrin repeat protein
MAQCPCDLNDIDTVKQLIENGLDPNTRYGSGSILRVYGQFSFEMVKFLVDHGANVNQTCNQNYIPLHEAAAYGIMDIIECLVANGSNIDAQTDTGDTPLMFAANYRKHDVVKYLLDCGANKDLVDVYGRDAAHRARHGINESWELAEYIESYEYIPTKGVQLEGQ